MEKYWNYTETEKVRFLDKYKEDKMTHGHIKTKLNSAPPTFCKKNQ